MAEAARAHDHSSGGGDDHGHHDIHPPSFYVKLYGILLVLLIISILGPELGNRWITLITAFGIAIVKAYMVCAYFMHLNIEKRYIWYMLYAMLLLVGLFYWGVAADINRPSGRNWENKAAITIIEQHATPAAAEPAPHQ